MPALTLAQIISTATTLNQGRTDYTSSELSLFANLAYQEVATRIRYNGLEQVAISSTTSGGFRLPTPSDFAYPLGVSNLSMSGPSSYRELRQQDAKWFDSQSTALGTPVYFGLFGTWMELWPSPDSTYSLQLRYVTQPQTMVASTSTPGIEDRWHIAIAYKTAALLAAARNDEMGEAVHNARYLGYMGSTPSDAAWRQQGQVNLKVRWR